MAKYNEDRSKKECVTCKKMKELSCFGKVSRSADGLHGSCKECVNARLREWHRSHPGKAKGYAKRFETRHPGRIKELQEKWREENREEESKKAAARYQENIEENRRKAREGYAASADKRDGAWLADRREYARSYREWHREAMNKQVREHRAENIERMREQERGEYKENDGAGEARRHYARHREEITEKQRRLRREEPEMVRARDRVHWEVKQGRMARISEKECEDCGGQAQHYHHEDYGKPLEVVALCALCHKRRHEEAVPQIQEQ